MKRNYTEEEEDEEEKGRRGRENIRNGAEEQKQKERMVGREEGKKIE